MDQNRDGSIVLTSTLIFRSMDQNRDGSIDLREFQAGLRSLGIQLSRSEVSG